MRTSRALRLGFGLVALTTLVETSLHAQLVGRAEVIAFPERATIFEEVVLAVEGVAGCPRLDAPIVVEDGLIEVALSAGCPAIPLAPTPFRKHVITGGLSPGLWEVRVVLLDVIVTPPPPVAETSFRVIDPSFGVTVPDPVVPERRIVRATVDVFGSCVSIEDPRLDGNVIRIDVFESDVCDPPFPPEAQRFTVPLGPFPPGDYSVEVFADTFGEEELRPVAQTDLEVVANDTCIQDRHTLCLEDGRFAVTALWPVHLDVAQAAEAVPSTDNTGFFWLFEEDNLELMVKVLDGCATGFDSYWVFIGGVTDLEISVGITDTATGEFKSYSSPGGSAFVTVNDTSAFPCS